MKNLSLVASLLSLLILIVTQSLEAQAEVCKPSGKIKGGKQPPECAMEDDLCCIEGRFYTTYKCSPQESNHTKAILHLNSFEEGGDGSKPSKCDNGYHSDHTLVVALSTRWYKNGKRCLQNITISANGLSVDAMVVDECDSSMGCDKNHDYQPPCANNIVVASQAVWKALRVPLSQWGELDITWADA